MSDDPSHDLSSNLDITALLKQGAEGKLEAKLPVLQNAKSDILPKIEGETNKLFDGSFFDELEEIKRSDTTFDKSLIFDDFTPQLKIIKPNIHYKTQTCEEFHGPKGCSRGEKCMYIHCAKF